MNLHLNLWCFFVTSHLNLSVYLFELKIMWKTIGICIFFNVDSNKNLISNCLNWRFSEWPLEFALFFFFLGEFPYELVIRLLTQRFSLCPFFWIKLEEWPFDVHCLLCISEGSLEYAWFCVIWWMLVTDDVNLPWQWWWSCWLLTQLGILIVLQEHQKGLKKMVVLNLGLINLAWKTNVVSLIFSFF